MYYNIYVPFSEYETSYVTAEGNNIFSYKDTVILWRSEETTYVGDAECELASRVQRWLLLARINPKQVDLPRLTARGQEPRVRGETYRPRVNCTIEWRNRKKHE